MEHLEYGIKRVAFNLSIGGKNGSFIEHGRYQVS